MIVIPYYMYHIGQQSALSETIATILLIVRPIVFAMFECDREKSQSVNNSNMFPINSCYLSTTWACKC